MVLAGLAFALAGVVRGDSFFSLARGRRRGGFVLGMIVGAAFSHNFGLAVPLRAWGLTASPR
jgi:hypothetical protein